MIAAERFKIVSNEYMDLLIQYNGNMNVLKKYQEFSVQIINPWFAVIYVPMSEIKPSLVAEFGYFAIPKCYTLTSFESLSASGVTRLRSTPALNLRGQGVLVGIIDTGIDYTNHVFLNTNGTTKIVEIWDQSIESATLPPNDHYNYGTVYTSEQINMALKSSAPLEIVPSIDEIGHGTMLAGIAAGSEDKDNNFSGVVPDAELLVVKLKQAKKNLTDFYMISSSKPCYQENDITWAFQYLVETANRLNRPLAVCIGLGTSQGAHDNNGMLNSILSIGSDCPGIVVSIAAGNESISRRHFFSVLNPNEQKLVELNVGPNEEGFTIEFWGNPPMVYTMNILSPVGEFVPTILKRLNETTTVRFVFSETILYINYIMIEQDSGKQLIMLRFKNPTKGIWRFEVNGTGDLAGDFHIWLPAGTFISTSTNFINSNPYTTITSPGNSLVPITVTAYNPEFVLYTNSGKGYSTSNIINPDLAAPGVNILCPTLNHDFTRLTGTSAAAAHMAGITAMVLEWGIVKNYYPNLDTIGVKKFLIRGAKRRKTLLYPNQDWGYGIVDIFNSYDVFKRYI